VRKITPVLFVSLLAGSHAFAEPAQFPDARWDFRTIEGGARLLLAIPDTDIIDFEASCALGSGIATVWIAFALPDEAGKTIKFYFRKGSKVVEADADIPKEADGIEGFDPTMTVPISSELFVMLRRESSVDIEAGGKTGQIPLAGSARHVAAFVQACWPKVSRQPCEAGRGSCLG
jgi:hypothetical protein